MKTRLFLVIVLMASLKTASAQSVRVIDFETLEKRIKSPSDTTFIVHFWATWCKPCLAEMPVFNEIKTSTQKLQIVLVSLDFVKDLDNVNRFLEKKPIKADSFLLNAPDQNSWIDKISSQWTGGIPATLFLNDKLKKQKFIENSLTFDQLKAEINEF